MKLFLILLISLNCFANISGAELKKPNSTAFDFTFQSPQNKIQESLQDMIKIEIGKENFLTRRNNNIWDCKMDQFGTAYCPSELKNASIVSSPLPVEIKTVNHTIYEEKVANVFYVAFNLGLQDYQCTIPGDRYSGFVCKGYGYVNVSSIKFITGTESYRYNTYYYGGDTSGQSYGNGTSSGNYSGGSYITTSTFRVVNGVLQDYQCAIPGDQYSNFVCKGYGYVNVSSIRYVIGIDTSGYSGAFFPIYGYFRVIKTCPTGTVQEGNQCKGINYVCPSGYTDNGSNCKKTITYSCNSNLITPVLLDGNWKCGSLVCDGNLKCGYGTCDLPSKPSLDKYQDVAYNPLQYITNNQCNGDICDYVLNAKVSYCESQQCPKGDDIIQDSGKCYKLECPAGTYLSGDKCIKVN